MGIFETDTIAWEIFSEQVDTFFKRPGCANAMKFVCNNAGYVHKEVFSKVLSWFSPLGVDPTLGYTVETMLEVLSYPWFHGFMSVYQAKTVLLNSITEDGTFLVRFSSQPGAFALSVVQNKSVCHCRIDSTKKQVGIGYAIAPFHTRTYNTLAELIERHHVEPLGIRESKGVIKDNAVLLKVPFLRSAEDPYELLPNNENLYHSV